MKKFIRSIAIILSALMIIQVVPVGAVQAADMSLVQYPITDTSDAIQPLSAEEAAVTATSEATVDDNLNRASSPIIGEVLELRGESTKHFRHLDGTFTVALYAEPVHFKDSEGKWQNIDNTLSLDSSFKNATGRTTYTPAASALDIRIPQDFSNGQMITIGRDGYTFGMGIKAQTNDAASEPEVAAAEEPSAVTPADDAVPAGLEEQPAAEEQTASKVIDLATIKAEVNNDLTAEAIYDTSKTEIEADNAEKMKQNNLTSAVTYRDIFPDADLGYQITPSQIKEIITIKAIQDGYTYLFNLSLGGLIPVPQEDGSIYLLKAKDDEDPLLILDTPYMVDAAGEDSTAVTMTLAEDGTLTLTADSAWINDADRTLPVMIDPTVTVPQSNMDDAYISTAAKNTNYQNATYNYAGAGLLGTRRTYMKFTLPKLPEGSVVTGAALAVMQNSCFYYSAGNYLCVFDLTGKSGWSPSSVTWNNQPVSKDINGPKSSGVKIIDYKAVNSASNVWYDFNITKTVKNWYENSNNNGIMLTTYNESSNTQSTLYCTRYNADTSRRPAVQIAYNYNIGLEDYWSYESIDLGRSDTAYIDNYSGSLTYIFDDLAMTGNRLPINISHVYHSNYDGVYGIYQYGFNVGANFHLNLQEVLYTVNSSDLYNQGYRYVYHDADGTSHYFKQQIVDGVTKVALEYNTSIVLTSGPSGTNIITDAQGNKKHFNGSQLIKLEDQNGNIQTITWSGNRITQVTDPAGRVAAFGYDANNRLISITDPAGRSTTYAYNASGQLTKITRPGGKTTSFLYTTNNGISRITADNSSYATFSYITTAGCGRRVSYAYQYDKAGVQVDYLRFQYTQTNTSGQATGNTLVTNKNGKSSRYLFDGFGRATSVTNQDGQTQYSAHYSLDPNNPEPNKFNKLKETSELQTIANNVLQNHGFERAVSWSHWRAGPVGSATYSTINSRFGTRSMLVQSTDASCLNATGQDFVGVAGQTYTLSVDAYIPSQLAGTCGVKIGINYEVSGGSRYDAYSEYITSTVGWQRFTHTVTLPANATGNCRVMLTLDRAIGSVYFDNVQLEKSGGARLYNLVENSDFSYNTGTNVTPWIMSGTQSGDGVQTISGRNYALMSGAPGNAKKISQTVPVKAQAGDVLIIGGRAAAYATQDTNNIRKFGIIAEIYSTNTTKVETIPIDFDRSISMEHQTKATFYQLTTDCYKVVYSFVYYYHVDSVSFDDAFIYVGGFGENYGYDNKGQLTEVNNHEGTLYEYYFSGTKLTAVSQTISGTTETVADIDYVGTTNKIDTITNSVDTEIDYTYTPNGQVASQTVTTAEGEEVVESTTYIQGGNYPKSFIDANGGVTTYTYDNNDQALKGLVVKLTDPKGNETTYTYDPNTDELLSTTGKANPSTPVTTTIVMQDYLPKTITRNGMNYSYDYDNQNRVTATKVGNQTLMSNAYDSRRRLSQQTYANGATYMPMYDNRDRIIGDKWNNVQTAEYLYNENDRLSQTVDKTTGVAYRFDYAFFGLLNKITGSDGTLTAYDYDMAGKLSHLTFSKNNDTIFQARFVTNEKGNVEDVILGDPLDNINDDTALHYNYDGLGRLTGSSTGPLVSLRTYMDGANGTTDFVDEYMNEDGAGNMVQQYGYGYDPNGNITEITESVAGTADIYSYDDLNRLTSETKGGNALTYLYDAGGNLTSVKQNNVVVHNYTYGNANWKDQLTKVDNNTISYDALGNPLTYNGYTFTWQKGSQLASFSGNGLNVTYTYNASGQRIQQIANGTTINYLYSDNLLMRQSDGANILDFQYDASGNAVGFKFNGTVYYYLRNLQGDVVAITDMSGIVVGTYIYDAYGNLVSYTGAMASINPIRYRGYYQDPHTGWYFLQTRYYNPDWRRFLNADALFVAGDAITGSNMYAYCNGNPLNFTDSNGMAPTWYGDLFGNGMRLLSKAAGWIIRRPTERFFQEIADPFLVGIKATPGFGDDFATSWVCQNLFLPAVQGALYEMIDIDGKPKSEWTFDIPSGLRHIFFANMSLGAPYAEYFLGFEPNDFQGKGWFGRSKTFKNYTTVDVLRDKYMWQQELGYTTMYDMFFSMGGPIQRIRYEFADTSGTLPMYYCIWLWKGDYWNLGAGAEIGIYSTDNEDHVENHFYNVDPKLNLHVRMKIDYAFGVWPILSRQTVNDFHQSMWWVCSFTPEIQKPRIDRLFVDLDVRFANNPEPGYGNNYLKLMKPFYTKRQNLIGTSDEWTGVSMLPYANKPPLTGHTTHPKCGARPENCTHTCPLGNTLCGSPCTQYTTKCTSNDYRCEHYGDSDNGFQFHISY